MFKDYGLQTENQKENKDDEEDAANDDENRRQNSADYSQQMKKPLQKQEQSSEPHTYQRTRTWSGLSAERQFYESHGYDDYLEDNFTQALAAYNSDKMECEARWDQEQIKQLESLTITEQQPYSPNKTG